jgi:HD-GYP domain-containing protein (c-di-GMP phosphodiesterase class II)
MLSDRPYRTALEAAAARDELRAVAGAQLDPIVVAALEDVLGATGDADLQLVA